MRKSKLLKKWRAGQPARVCALGHFIPAYICHAAHFGFDAIWLDLEHRTMSDLEVQALFAYFHLYDIDCMLRPATLEKSRLYRYLEDGATGLMIPHVSTREKAQALVEAVKFPPLGDRGLDGAGCDSDFHLHPTDTYVDEVNRETFLVVQIETLQALENVESIASVAGVDGLFVGPGDLGLRIRRTKTDWTLESAIERVALVAKQNGKAWGCPAGSAEQVKNFYSQGAQLLAHGGEFIAVMEMLHKCSETLDSVYGASS